MQSYNDFASLQQETGRIVVHTLPFPLIPTNLDSLDLPVTLRWQQAKFESNNVDAIAEQPGIYAFAVSHGKTGLPPHGYILYIGEVGAKKGPTRTLRARFKEYFREKDRPKRKHIFYFLNAWETCLIFHFAPLDPNTADLLQIEMKLNDAMMPPFSRGDFSPEIRPLKRLAEMFR